VDFVGFTVTPTIFDAGFEAGLLVPSEQRTSAVERICRAVADWASSRPDVCAVALVGSWARGAATTASDLDLVILSDAPLLLTQRERWWEFLGDAEVIRTQAWGIAVEHRLRLPSGFEVEFTIAPRKWTDVPLDPGTRRVLSDGARFLFDPERLLERAIASLES